MAQWNERRPECAHQLTGETKGWKIASARTPTGLHRCAVCDKCLHGPSRLLSCWTAAGLLVPEMILCTLPIMVGQRLALRLDCDEDGTLPRETRQQSAT